MSHFPTAILIGFQKAGTTFLRKYFSLHPEIQWSKKAIFFTLNDFNIHKEDYFKLLEKRIKPCYIDTHEAIALSYFRKNALDWGEQDLAQDVNSENQLVPSAKTIPRRIHDLLPETKIILVIRNQLDWIRSNFIHYQSRMPSNQRQFSFFIKTPEGKRLLSGGQYDELISAYIEIFGAENIHVALLEQFILELENSMKRLCSFLAVSYFPYPKDEQDKNKGYSLARASVVSASSKLGFEPKNLKVISPLFETIEKFISPLWQKDIFTRSERRLLRAFYAASNARSSSLLNIDLEKYGYPL